jgi:hypothetical protein
MPLCTDNLPSKNLISINIPPIADELEYVHRNLAALSLEGMNTGTKSSRLDAERKAHDLAL